MHRYLHGDLSILLYEMAGSWFNVTEIARILPNTKLSADIVGQKRPTKVQMNFSFLVNCSLLKDRRNIQADDLGTWNHNRVITRYFNMKKDVPKK